MCSQKQTSYNEMRLDIFWVAHTKLRYRLIIQPTVQPQTPVCAEILIIYPEIACVSTAILGMPRKWRRFLVNDVVLMFYGT